jgi:hypothetical protein
MVSGKLGINSRRISRRVASGLLPKFFHAGDERIPKTEDSLAERGEFELPVPICEQTHDSGG